MTDGIDISPSHLSRSGGKLGDFGTKLADGGKKLESAGQNMVNSAKDDQSGFGAVLTKALGKGTEITGKVFTEGGGWAQRAGKNLHSNGENHRTNDEHHAGVFKGLSPKDEPSNEPKPAGNGHSGSGAGHNGSGQAFRVNQALRDTAEDLRPQHRAQGQRDADQGPAILRRPGRPVHRPHEPDPGGRRPGRRAAPDPGPHPPVQLPAGQVVRPVLGVHCGPAARGRSGRRALRGRRRHAAGLPDPGGRHGGAAGRGAALAVGAHRHRLRHRPAGDRPGLAFRRYRPDRGRAGRQRSPHRHRPRRRRCADRDPALRRLPGRRDHRARPDHRAAPAQPRNGRQRRNRRPRSGQLPLRRRGQPGRGAELGGTATAVRLRRAQPDHPVGRPQRHVVPLRLRRARPLPAGLGRGGLPQLHLRLPGRRRGKPVHHRDQLSRPHQHLSARRELPRDGRNRPARRHHPVGLGPLRQPALAHRPARPHHPIRLRRCRQRHPRHPAGWHPDGHRVRRAGQAGHHRRPGRRCVAEGVPARRRPARHPGRPDRRAHDLRLRRARSPDRGRRRAGQHHPVRGRSGRPAGRGHRSARRDNPLRLRPVRPDDRGHRSARRGDHDVLDRRGQAAASSAAGRHGRAVGLRRRGQPAGNR